MNTQDYLSRLYANRFDHRQLASKAKLWRVLVQNFLSRYIPANAAILDIGGGYGEFINQVDGREKVLVDLNPDARQFAHPTVQVLCLDILDAQARQASLQVNYFDIIFVSNFFEHLHSKEDLVQVLLACFDCLAPGGSLLIIQPNFKYSFREYYDFIDHHLAITHRSLQEILLTIGFTIDILIPRFLPFSTQGRPTSPRLLALYLKLPILWRFFGGQLFIKADKPR